MLREFFYKLGNNVNRVFLYLNNIKIFEINFKVVLIKKLFKTLFNSYHLLLKIFN